MIYLVCCNTKKGNAVELVPEKKTIAGFLFAPFWLVANGLWRNLAYYIISALILVVILPSTLINLYFPIITIIHIYIFLEGNHLRLTKLLRKGYELADIIDAPDDKIALVEYLRRNPKRR